MISQDAVKKFADKYQTTELTIKREYLQHLFLSYFYKEENTENVYFKGGTALRFIYRSPCFSEDLDFSSSLKETPMLGHIIISTFAQIEHEGIQTEIEEAKQTTGGYLAIVRFKTNSTIIPIQLEISLRGEDLRGEHVTIASDLFPLYALIQLEKSQLIDGKLNALLSRRKPRDFYDLYFMLRAGLLSGEQKNLLSQALEALHQSPNLNFEQELKIFLPKSHWPIIRELPQALEGEIQRFL